MSSRAGLDHVVVDGSNIATEGRSLPSLAQLQEAVMSFIEEHPDTAVTVVVDATFGHRIDKSEAKEYDDAVANNEVVAPPAGAIGRGDAFVLGIADKAGATVVSNDSFQEFHGEYEWLFEEGRLIGGKPVPHVGWVWVDRVPVRGPVSRKATRSRSTTASKKSASKKRSSRSGSSDSSSSSSRRRGSRKKTAAATEPAEQPASTSSDRSSAPTATAPTGRAPTGSEAVNEMLPFLEFVETHPVGTEVRGTVDAYSSHGAYVRLDDADVRAYVPLRLMDDPAPRSAKQVMKQGDSVDLVVVAFAAERRSIDCAVPTLAPAEIERNADAERSDETDPGTTDDAGIANEADAQDVSGATADGAAASDDAPAQPAARRRASKTTTRKKSARKKSATKKAAAETTTATKTATKKTAAKKTATKKTAAKKTAAKKAATKKTARKKTATKKTATSTSRKKSATKKAASKRATKKSASKKAASKKAATKKTARSKTTGA